MPKGKFKQFPLVGRTKEAMDYVKKHGGDPDGAVLGRRAAAHALQAGSHVRGSGVLPRPRRELVRRGMERIWNELERLATDVEGMPASCRPAKGLRTQLEEVAMHVMRDVQDRCEAMLATAHLPTMRRE